MSNSDNIPNKPLNLNYLKQQVVSIIKDIKIYLSPYCDINADSDSDSYCGAEEDIHTDTDISSDEIDYLNEEDENTYYETYYETDSGSDGEYYQTYSRITPVPSISPNLILIPEIEEINQNLVLAVYYLYRNSVEEVLISSTDSYTDSPYLTFVLSYFNIKYKYVKDSYINKLLNKVETISNWLKDDSRGLILVLDNQLTPQVISSLVNRNNKSNLKTYQGYLKTYLAMRLESVNSQYPSLTDQYIINNNERENILLSFLFNIIKDINVRGYVIYQKDKQTSMAWSEPKKYKHKVTEYESHLLLEYAKVVARKYVLTRNPQFIPFPIWSTWNYINYSVLINIYNIDKGKTTRIASYNQNNEKTPYILNEAIVKAINRYFVLSDETKIYNKEMLKHTNIKITILKELSDWPKYIGYHLNPYDIENNITYHLKLAGGKTSTTTSKYHRTFEEVLRTLAYKYKLDIYRLVEGVNSENDTTFNVMYRGQTLKGGNNIFKS